MRHLQPKEARAGLQAQRGLPAEDQPLVVDVRMAIESLCVGRPPGVVNIPRYDDPNLTPDPHGVARKVLEEAGRLDRPAPRSCRSGKRTWAAGAAPEAAGFTDVGHGFKGELDEPFHRFRRDGWRFQGLPWEPM